MTKLENVRINNDVRINTSLVDNGVKVDWPSLSDIHAAIYSEAQRMMAGICEIHVDPKNEKNLIVKYAASKPQYKGVQRLVVRCTYKGKKKTYDTLAFNFVATTDELAEEPIEMSDPEVNVELQVNEVSTSLLDEAIDACIKATEQALEASRTAEQAATHQPIIGKNGNWHTWSTELQTYEDTGLAAQGPAGKDGMNGANGEKGDKGDSGNINYPTFDINGAMELVMDSEAASDADRFELDQEGNLTLNI